MVAAAATAQAGGLVRCGLIGGLLVAFCLAIPHAYAASPTGGAMPSSLNPAQMLDQIENLYANAAAPMANRLQSLAEQIFFALAVIDFGYSAARLVLRGGDLGDWSIELVQQGMSIGFLYYLLTNFSGLATDVISGLQDAAAIAANTAAPNAGNIFAAGLNVGTTVLSHMSAWPSNWGVDLALASSGIIIVILYALIAAYILFVIIEAHVAVVVGMLFMGIGPSRWTNSYAMRAVNYVFAISAKLFVMEILVGIGQVIMEDFAAQSANATIAGDLSLVGAAIVFIALVRSIPDIVQGVVSGASFNTGGALASAIGGAAGTVAGGIASGVGAANAIGEAAQLASATAGGDAGGAGAGGGGGGGSGAGGSPGAEGNSNNPKMSRPRLMARTAGILGRAAMADMRGRGEGDPATRGGRMSGRMARRIRSANPDRTDGPILTPDP